MKQKLKKQIFKFLESALLKAFLRKLVISSTGIQGWLVSFVFSELFEKIAIPVLNLAIRKGELFYDMQKGKIQIKRLEHAKDIDEYNDAVDDILQ